MWSFLFISNHLQASGWELASTSIKGGGVVGVESEHSEGRSRWRLSPASGAECETRPQKTQYCDKSKCFLPVHGPTSSRDVVAEDFAPWGEDELAPSRK